MPRIIKNEINLFVERRQIDKGGANNGGLAVYSRGDQNQT
jgi:hypothetical protein